jgi:hypothetical protein
MKLQTVIEQLRETTLGSECDIERTTATPSRLTCRWEQDTRGKLACFWSSMRAYLTIAGMAFGLVALWAALVPLLA